jgi:hypothetical protein
MYSLLSGY